MIGSIWVTPQSSQVSRVPLGKSLHPSGAQRQCRRGVVRFPLRLPWLTDCLLLQGWLIDPVTHIGCSVYKVAGDRLPVCRPGTGGLL